MYTVWNVAFHFSPDNQGPCDPFYLTEPLVRGRVGDADPFSEAFGRVLINAEDSLTACLTPYQQASSVISDTSDIFAIHSPMQESPYTPNTAQSTFSRSDRRSSTSRQLYNLPTSPNVDCYTGKIESLVRTPTSTEQSMSFKNIVDELPWEREDHGYMAPPQLVPSRITEAPLAATCQVKPSNNAKQAFRRSVKKKRKRKVTSTTRRPPLKTREQHLSDNKAAAAKCRQQRRARETKLLDASIALKASVDASKSEINKLVNEVMALRRQVWECPTCAERYVYLQEFQSHGIPLEVDVIDTMLARTSPLLA